MNFTDAYYAFVTGFGATLFVLGPKHSVRRALGLVLLVVGAINLLAVKIRAPQTPETGATSTEWQTSATGFRYTFTPLDTLDARWWEEEE